MFDKPYFVTFFIENEFMPLIECVDRMGVTAAVLNICERRKFLFVLIL